MTEQTWFTVKQAHEYTGRGITTITDALRCQELVGYQRNRGGHWRIHRDALDAWVRGEIAPVIVPTVTRRRQLA